MEYISSEEFLKQPNEVQGVFIDWWEPSEGDIYSLKRIGGIGVANGNINEGFKNECIPLFTEGQLRKFIEDKTKYKIVYNYNYEGNIIVGLKDIKSYGFIKEYETDEADLLQAYWKVSCEIAKEQI